MGSWALSKHTACPRDGGDAILLVDVETESVPQTDEDGNPLYYCLEGEHTFSVKAVDGENAARTGLSPSTCAAGSEQANR